MSGVLHKEDQQSPTGSATVSPRTEAARLLALHSFDMLDTAPDQALDELTTLAATICAAPIALLSLVDETGARFWSRHGLDIAQIPRDASFCAHAINGEDLLVVPDAAQDERFASSPLVAGEAQIRFYAGVPLLTSDGHALGTLCVLDRRPRRLSSESAQALRVLARQAVAQLELGRTAEALDQSERRFRSIVDEANVLLKTEQDAGVELTSQNEELRELDALKDQFVSVVSHELRTPLTAIRGYLEIVLAEEPGPLNEEQKRLIEIVDFSSDQLLRVVGDLLLIGKAEAGHLALAISEIDLREMLEACVVAAKPTAEAKQIDLQLASGELPPIPADRGRLSQALGNIISNAIKFTDEGRVDVRVRAEDGRAVIEVTDTGKGIPTGEVDHLFVPFFRASTATRQAIPGTGLGLSIAKEIVEAHGGSISVESEEGSGTSFRVELPTSGPRT